MELLLIALVAAIMVTLVALGFAILFLPWRVRQGMGRPKLGILYAISVWVSVRFMLSPLIFGGWEHVYDFPPMFMSLGSNFLLQAVTWNFISKTWRWEDIPEALRVRRLRREAEHQASRLQTIIPEDEWSEFRREIKLIAYEHIPLILRDKRQLERVLETVKHFRSQQPNRHLMSEFEREQANQMNSDIEELERALLSQDTELSKSVAFLNHLTSRLHLARRKIEARVDLESQMHSLMDDLTALTQAHGEIEETTKQLIYLPNKDKN
jgi:hypothetical protein